jgi:hypothetical protein
LKERGFRDMVTSCWEKYKFQGWTAFVTQNKLKHLKCDIKKWVAENIGDLEARIKSLSEAVAISDKEMENGELTRDEQSRRHQDVIDLVRCLKRKDSLRYQQF